MTYTRKTILTIEAIRGIAAIYVMLGHIALLYHIPESFPKYEFWIRTLFGYGHQAVLLFFIVSGFSITYSAYGMDLSKPENLKAYLYKRFRRIYPLFLIVLIFSLVVLWLTGIQSDPGRNILSFIFLTDNAEGAIANPIPTNFPIWSLSYEVIYYVMFPGLIRLWNRIGTNKLLVLVLLLSGLAGLTGFAGRPNHIFNILQYYWIWVAGAILADLYIRNTRISFSFLKGSLVASAGIMLTFEEVPVVRDWFWSVSFLLVFTSFFIDYKTQKNRRILGNLIIGLTSLAICYLLTYTERIVFHAELLRLIVPGLGIVLLILVFMHDNIVTVIPAIILKPFVRAGSFSYALYIIHWPLIVLMVFLTEKYLGRNMIILTVLIPLNIALAIVASLFLEEKLQPRIVRVLNSMYYRTK